MIKDNKFEDMLAYHDNFAVYKHVKSVLIHEGHMTVTPLVSIMIPTYNRSHFLGEAIASALNQKTEIPFEVVIVDNGQDEDTVNKVNEIVASFNAPNLILYRNRENIGMFGNWNRCIELARSEYLTILNDDDKLDLSWISNAIKNSEKDKMVAFDCQLFGSKNSKSKPRQFLDLIIRKIRLRESIVKLPDIFYCNPLHCGSLTAIIKKSCAISLGGFDDVYWPTSDYIFVIRYWLKFGIKIIHVIGGYYRIEENASLKKETLEGFIRNDYKARNSMLSKFVKGKIRLNILLLISLAQAIIRLCNYKKLLFSKSKVDNFPVNEFGINNKFLIFFMKNILSIKCINMGFNIILRILWKLCLPSSFFSE